MIDKISVKGSAGNRCVNLKMWENGIGYNLNNPQSPSNQPERQTKRLEFTKQDKLLQNWDHN